MTFKLSLIICSRNREYQLNKCLEFIDIEEMLINNCELILVDNCSTDATSEVIKTFASKSNSIKYIYEPNPGLSYARNAGIENAHGEIIAFTDDDCYLTSEYFKLACKIFDSNNFSYCGGSVSIYDSGDSDYGRTYHKSLEIIPPKSFIPAGKILGANMLFLRDVITKIGPFDIRLGAGTQFRCEDVDYCVRASLAGFYGALVPGLHVMHHHGRKNGGIEIEQLMLQDNIARGAYYAKHIIGGNLSFIHEWMKLSLKHFSISSIKSEIDGAIRYLINARG